MKRIFLAALFLGVVFHQDFIWQYALAPPDKVMAPLQSGRTYLGDHYYYYILAKKAVLKLTAAISPLSAESIRQQSFFYDNSGLENIYGGALLVSGLIDQIAQHIPVGWNLKLAISLMLQLSFLLTGVLAAYAALRRSPIPVAELALFGFLWAFFCRGVLYGIYTGVFGASLIMPAIDYYPDVLRIVNPQVSWAVGMFYVALIASWLQNPTRAKYAGLILLSLCLGSISVAVMLTFALGLGLYGLADLIQNRKIHFPLLGIGLAMLVSLLYARHQFALFYLTEKGMSLQTGRFTGLHLHLSPFLMLAFLPLIRTYLPAQTRAPLSWIYIAGLMLGVIAPSFELGDRLWVRGSGAFVWFMLLYGLLEWGRRVIAARWNRHLSSRYAPVAVCLALILWAGMALSININGWYGYIEKDKADVISWLRTHATRNDIVVSADLEDAYLIPMYTNSQPYVQLRDYSAYAEKEVLQHYFETLDLMGLKKRYMTDILSYAEQEHPDIISRIAGRADPRVPYEQYQTHAFYGAVLYYPFTVTTRNIYASAGEHQAFIQKILRISGESHSENIGKIDYIIFKKNADMKIPRGYETRFDNASYNILSAQNR